MVYPPTLFKLSTAAAAAIAGLCHSPFALAEPLNADAGALIDAHYNPGEGRGSFEMVMKPYPIPVQTTTYVDFAFNLPDDAPDLFHVVYGEVVNSQPEHLHHFIVTGCATRIDPSEEGLPRDRRGRDCTFRLGGWAPGASIFGTSDTNLNTGRLMGRGLGIEAILLQVHYTDGAYADAAAGTFKMAADGIRVHYTPDFRPYTTSGRAIINVGMGEKSMVIPPGVPRFYLTRTCKVASGCRDSSPERMGQVMAFLGMEGKASCASAKPLCGAGGTMGSRVVRLCPATCGFCDESLEDGAPNPLNPESYWVTAVNYHAHLLGREMYATLLRDEMGPAAPAAAAVLKSTPTVTTTADLESKQFWIYDYQETFPIDREVPGDDGTFDWGNEIRPGDRIQATCVYDSTARNTDTRFGLSTYNEMCITSLFVTFATPASLLEGGEDGAGGGPGLAAELSLLMFRCDEDEETDMHVGALRGDEDARDIWRDHPLRDAGGCTFPHSQFLVQGEVRCPPGVGSEDEGEEKEDSSSSHDADQELESDLEWEMELELEPEPEQAQLEVSSSAPMFVTRSMVLAVHGGVAIVILATLW